MEFPLFSHSIALFLSLSFLASLHSICVYDCENKYSEFRFYSHALVSMNNEGCWFCENKNDDTTQHQHKEPKRSRTKWKKEQKNGYFWRISSIWLRSPSLYFFSVFFVCFFLLYYRWRFDFKPFLCAYTFVCLTTGSQTKSSHFLTAFDLISLSWNFYLFVCEQIATLTRTHSKIKCNHFQFLLSYTITVWVFMSLSHLRHFHQRQQQK